MTLRDWCPDKRTGKGTQNPLRFTDNHLLCGAFPGDALADRLWELPRLRSLTMAKMDSGVHGLPWTTLSAILSTPHLRELKVLTLHFCPILREGEQLNVDSLSPLTSFHYRFAYPAKSAAFPTVIASLSAVLGKLCGTLETLVLPTELVSVSSLSQLQWPRLRELTFIGRDAHPSSASPTMLCPVMPVLRRLTIFISDDKPQTMCPSGGADSFLWSNLDQLKISSPDPQDGIYDHLPSTLRRLSLRYWPHFCAQQSLYDDKLRYRSVSEPQYDSILDSSAVLSILRRCDIPELDYLELEYQADDDDDALWQYITSAFPRLTRLTIHRLRSARDKEQQRDVSVVSAYTVIGGGH